MDELNCALVWRVETFNVRAYRAENHLDKFVLKILKDALSVG